MFYFVARAAIFVVLTWIAKVRLWWLRRRLAKVKLQNEEEEEFRLLRDFDRRVLGAMFANKDEIIAKTGQEWWDRVMKRLEELDRRAAEASEEKGAEDSRNS
jgi:hypothetical protein